MDVDVDVVGVDADLVGGRGTLSVGWPESTWVAWVRFKL